MSRFILCRLNWDSFGKPYKFKRYQREMGPLTVYSCLKNAQNFIAISLNSTGICPSVFGDWVYNFTPCVSCILLRLIPG
jgi:hypothetical protein